MMREILAEVEAAAVDVIAVFGPWLGPVPSAYLVGRAAVEALGWHWPVALAAALAVESIGVVSVVTALRLWEWNQTRNKTDPEAPFWLAVAAVCVYFVVAVGLTVLVDVVPGLVRYAPAVFPFLAAIGAVNIALKNGQRRREEAKAGRKRRRRARQDRRKVSGKVPEGYGDWRSVPASVRKEMAEMSPAEIAEAISERTARAWRARAERVDG